MFQSNNSPETNTDVILIGAGIMSATLGVLLKELEPNLSIQIFERLEEAAAESTDAWNNAGTGHSAFCELNYTPEKADGTIDISKAVKIAEAFEVSRQYWAYLVENRYLDDPKRFISDVPHMSFVWGNKNIDFLRKRHQALIQSPLFRGMQYSEDYQQMRQWMPLVMEGRDMAEPVAATRMDIGTDVNFGSLTRCLLECLDKRPNVSMHLGHEVKKLKQQEDRSWRLKVKNLKTGEKRKVTARFVFIGAGGGALPLLLKSGIPESKGFGGFPVSGQWLVCKNPNVIEKHGAKVYGLASVGTPPMSVPHLDTRIIGNKKALLFGPYAGFTTRFLKKGSLLDLIKSIKPSNLKPMLEAGFDNIPLTRYLIDQVLLSPEERIASLKAFYPEARPEDWELAVAGQRVQIIKNDPEQGGKLEFGTEVVSAADGSIAALLGASPGASTAVSIMINLLHKCFKEKAESPEWKAKLKQMIPSYEQSLADDEQLCQAIRKHTSEVLGLNKITAAV